MSLMEPAAGAAQPGGREASGPEAFVLEYWLTAPTAGELAVWCWRLRTHHGHTIAHGGGYESREECVRALQLLRAGAGSSVRCDLTPR